MIKFIKKIWDFGWGIYNKNKEVWNYLISGGLGVVVSVGSYEISRLIGFDIVVSNIISWIIAVLFMYLTNKFFVFRSKCKNKLEVVKEFVSFIAARIFTLLVETGILVLGVNLLHINDTIVKIIAQIIIIILNYVLSKLIIFKKDKDKNKEEK